MKRTFLLIISLLSTIWSNAFAGINFDAKSHGTSTSGTSTTVSHTCSGSNLVLLVFAGTHDSFGASSVAYNSVSLTQVANRSTRADLVGHWWYLPSPALGAHDIVVTWSGSVTKAVVIGQSY